jgi:hypothetical protein
MKVLALALVCGLLGCDAARQAPTAPVVESISPSLRPISQAPTTRLGLSSIGIPETRAIELARIHTSLTTFVSASAGPFRDLNIQPGVGPDYPIKPDRIVWAVTFSGDISICSPVGICLSPRPAVIAVFLDHLTGDFLSSETNSPAP